MKTEQTKKDFYAVKQNGMLKNSIKDVDTTSRTVSGFYNSYNFFDSANDVLMNGCCAKSILENGPKSEATAKIKHALNHDLTKLPGKNIVLEERTIDDITGIYFETKMANTTLGNDTLMNYMDGVYDNHSIGYRYVNLQYVEREAEKEWNAIVSQIKNPEAVEGHDYLFAVKEIHLFEGSTVAFGCNSLTPFLGMKSGNPETFKLGLMNRILTLEKVLTKGTQSDDTMQSLNLQCLQLKQVLSDLCDMIPDEKKSMIKVIDKPIIKSAPRGLISDSLIANFKL